MKIYILIVLIVIFDYASACDSCSSSFAALGNQSFQLEKNNIGLSWSYVSQFSKVESFEGILPNNIRIHQHALIGAFHFKKRFQLSIVVPAYLSYSNQKYSYSVGDPVVNVRYKIWDNKNLLSQKASHNIFGLVGLKLPLGVFLNQSINQVNNISYSSKTLDFLIGISYLYEKASKGFNLSFAAKINTKSDTQIRQGHVVVLKTLFYAKKKWNKFLIMPFVGITSEYISKFKINDFERPYTGGKALYLSIGANIRYNNLISMSFNPELPIWQDYKIQNGTIFTNIRINLNTKILF